MAVVTSSRAAKEPAATRREQKNRDPKSREGKDAAASDATKSGAAARAYHKRLARISPGHAAALRAQARKLQAPTTERVPFIATVIAMLVVGLALTLLFTTNAAETAYQIGAARAENKKLSDRLEAMRSEAEVRNAAPALALEAGRLGMIPAREVATLSVARDGSVTLVGTPTPAQGEPLPPFNRVRTSPQEGGGPVAGAAGAELEVTVPLPVDQIPVPIDAPYIPPPAPEAEPPREPEPAPPAAVDQGPVPPADGAFPVEVAPLPEAGPVP